MAPLLIENMENIKEACKKYKVKYLYVFGSAARGTDFGNDSDVDFLYAFDKDKIEFDNYADNYFDFLFKLEDTLKRKIDLVPEEKLTNPYLVKNINADKVKVYG
jgi:hypothetical protein